MPPSTIDIRIATADDRLPLYRMLELYQYELSDIWDQDLDAHGEYGYALDHYWGDERCTPFVARVAGRYAGFALVDDQSKVAAGRRWMDQYFVLKKYRRQGLGAALARHVFDALPGAWEVGQMPANTAAQAFWRRVIAAATQGRYSEQPITEGWWQGIVQCFELPPHVQPPHADR